MSVFIPDPYGDKSYWEDRYRQDSVGAEFDWYVPYEGAVRDLILRMLDGSKPTLMVGCGNSPMSAQMAADGFESIHNIDSSISVIEQMTKRGPGEALSYAVEDACDLSFENSSYSQIIDKGTYDAVAQGGQDQGRKMLSECSRILKPGGIFVMISHSPPIYRTDKLMEPQYGWQGEFCALTARHNQHFAYVMVKELDIDKAHGVGS